MKTKQIASVPRTESSNPFNWAKVHAYALKLRAMLPAEFREILPIESVKSLKITLSLLAVCIALILPAIVYLPIIVMIAYGNRHLISSVNHPSEQKGGRS